MRLTEVANRMMKASRSEGGRNEAMKGRARTPSPPPILCYKKGKAVKNYHTYENTEHNESTFQE